MKNGRPNVFVVPPGTGFGRTLLEVMREAGLRLPALCGERGVCGGCSVRVVPAGPAKQAERRIFSAAQIADGYRLACLATAVPGARVSDFIVLAERPAAGGPGHDAAAAGPVRLAVDAGTTAVACALVSTATGLVLAFASAPNAQAAFGGDVISRIEYASRGAAERERLRDALAESIRAAALAACAAAGLAEGDIRGGAVAGNPAMIHLLLGAPTASLGKAPFRLAVKGGTTRRAAEARFPGDQGAPVAVLPLCGVTLGGDVVGGAVALGLDRPGPPRLLVDVGTNTEMVLSVPSRRARGGGGRRSRASVLGASAASGGAFEGESISCGMRAGSGSVTAARLEGGDVRLLVEGGGPPRGVAGSGLLDIAAILLRAGVVDPSGRMRARDELFGAVPPGLLGRIVAGKDGEPGFLVGRGPGGRSLVLTAGDVRQFQLAKAAIRAGVGILLSEAGIDAGDVAEIFLSGAFGSGVDVDSARVTGLFPAFPGARLFRSGNSALLAASEAARAPAFLLRANRFARRLRAVSLADHPEFAARFLAAMEFPA